MFKLILGLSNNDVESAKEAVKAYLKYGIDMIDCSCSMYPFLKRYIDESDVSKKPELCISIALADDAHSNKAKINSKNCVFCKKCFEICSNNAVEKKDNYCEINDKKCVGCLHCVKACKHKAIEVEKINSFYDDIERLKNEEYKPDWLELHLSVKKKKEIINNFRYVLKNYKGNISICLSRKYFGTCKIVKLIQKLKKIFDELNPGFDFMIQADGTSINNANDEYSSNLETLAFYKELKELDIKIILSGGLNSKTIELCKLFNLKPQGFAFGGYARKISKDETLVKKLVCDVKEFCK